MTCVYDSKRFACHDVTGGLESMFDVVCCAVAWMLQSRVTGMICSFYVWEIGLSLV